MTIESFAVLYVLVASVTFACLFEQLLEEARSVGDQNVVLDGFLAAFVAVFWPLSLLIWVSQEGIARILGVQR